MYFLHIDQIVCLFVMLQMFSVNRLEGALPLILASFAGSAVSLCTLGAAVQTHAKLTMARTVINMFDPLCV